MELKANPVATGALAAGIVPAAPVALAALAPVDLAALAAPARVDPVVSVVLAPVALVALADPAPVVTAVRARRVDLVAALLASLGIPRTAPVGMDPVAMDPVVAHVVRISVLNR